MNTRVVLVLRGVIGLALVGSLGVQALLGFQLWLDRGEDRADLRIALVALLVVGVVALQVIGVEIWRLLTMVRHGTVFSFAAFRHVDRVIAAIGAGAGVVLGLAVLAAYANRTTPGDEIAPGAVGIVCGLALVAGGVALVVYVMRTLLAQAVALDDETKRLQAELDGVI